MNLGFSPVGAYAVGFVRTDDAGSPEVVSRPVRTASAAIYQNRPIATINQAVEAILQRVAMQ